LSLLELGGPNAALASAGTDGIDGPTDAAGAVFDREVLSRAHAAGLDWRAALEANDAYAFSDASGALIRWGPTGTNVGDLHVLLIA
jgi:hydroxypyruvate reductase